jgi:NADP-reducing hydrogenase subunit HndB
MPRLTVDDLKRIRDENRQKLTLRSGDARAKVTVHMGTCGISAGAREVMTELLRLIETSGTSEVIVTTSGCAGLCSREPMATVELRGQPPVKYVDLTPQKMGRVFADHVMSGRVVAEFAIGAGCETTA